MDFGESSYINGVINRQGKWSLPQDTKTISVWSPSGGTGKSTVAASIACQLRHICNLPYVSARKGVPPRVLILSFCEFDDLTVQEMGYTTPMSRESETDGINALSMLDVIESTGGNPDWDDVEECLVAHPDNGVFFLPAMTTRDMISSGTVPSADVYRKILSAISRHFQFVVVDLPSIFYRDRGGLCQYAFSASDAICFVMEPDSRAYMGIYHLFDGMRGATGRLPLNPDKCVLVINKYVDGENKWLSKMPSGQMSVEMLVRSLARYFSRYAVLPFTEPSAYGNLLSHGDKASEQAVSDLTDQVLMAIELMSSQS